MAHGATAVYLEIGKTRTIAAAMDWPGWCRSGRDEASVLQALYDYGPRYAQVLKAASLEFHAPSALSDLVVVERLAGDSNTDFGVPSYAPSRDSEPVTPGDLQRLQEFLQACWSAFDRAVQAAAGLNLRKGPRGGGRDLDKIVEHVREAEVSYLSRLGGTLKRNADDDPAQALAAIRQAVITTLAASARGEIPERGPRGGLRWIPRYYVRRSAWHVLDHVWEIEDRAESPA